MAAETAVVVGVVVVQVMMLNVDEKVSRVFAPGSKYLTIAL